VVRGNPKELIRCSGIRGNSADDDDNSSDCSLTPRETFQPCAEVQLDGQPLKTDEYFETKLYLQRVRMSMRRNILRRTLSEDLYWEGECQEQKPTEEKQDIRHIRTRSYEPTPERKNFAEPCVSDLDDVFSAGDLEKVQMPSRKNPKKARKIRLNKKNRDDSNDSLHYQTNRVSGLNPQLLEQLGPVVKMPINGMSFQFHPQPQNSREEPDTTIGSSSITTQMNSLIMNQKPLPSKFYHLSKAANQYLFPIRDQKLLLMFPKTKEFAKAQIKIYLLDSSADADVSPRDGVKSSNSSPKKVISR
jgi:hypothetical protein